MPTPEELTRENVDRQLTACGWAFRSCAETNPYAGRGITMREFPLETREVDNLLFMDRKAMRVAKSAVEAGRARRG